MSVLARIKVLRFISRGPLAIAAMAAALTGCGASDGSVGVGSGQDPDPVALDFPIAYTKGPLLDEDMELQTPTDIREVQRFNIGTDLYVLDRASPTAPETNVTVGETLGLGDVRGVEISADGTTVLFAMRGPFDENLDDDEQPTWNIWEYIIPTDTLRRIIPDDLTAEEGHDIDPQYLPDGRIIFASTRQTQSKGILVDENKQQFEAFDENFDEPAFVLHVMDADGNDLRQVSFNQSHDLEPSLRDNGKVMFTRWDNAGGNNAMHLYQMNPDGGELELLYGAESHQTGTDGGTIQFVGAREMADGRVMAIAREFDHDELGGDVIAIEVQDYVENEQSLASIPGLPGPAQVSVTTNLVRTDEETSPGGRFSSAFPLWDGTDRVLASWAICRLVEDPAAEEPIIRPCTEANLANPVMEPANPLYGIWMYDPVDETFLPIVIGEEGVLITDVVAAQPRPNPTVIPEFFPAAGLEETLVQDNMGILNIRSVYDVDGVATDIGGAADIESLADPAQFAPHQRPRRFLRIEKAVSIPDDDIVDLDNTDFGPSIAQGMREIIGYAPIEPDGSVRVAVPANVALAISVLDINARRVSARHQNWIQVMPGQELSCNGCHSPFSGESHGRSGSFDSAYGGASGNGVNFANTTAAVSPNQGETMAEARTRTTCLDSCEVPYPTFDVIYQEFWTDMFADGDPNDRIEYRYTPEVAAVLPSLPVNKPSCALDWDPTCRIIINYEAHIHPLWGVERIIDIGGVDTDVTCAQSGCHLPLDAMDQLAEPAGSLYLGDDLDAQVMDHLDAYRELLFFDDVRAPMGGILVPVQTGVDINGDPIIQRIAPSMSANGARASSRFFSMFGEGQPHADYLSVHELRLISEWLDIGAQYYNNPFDVPEN